MEKTSRQVFWRVEVTDNVHATLSEDPQQDFDAIVRSIDRSTWHETEAEADDGPDRQNN